MVAKPRVVASLLAVVILLIAVGCGDDDDGGSGSKAADDGGGSFGNGLKLTDEVIAEPEVASIKEPWVRWNSETCAYEETTDHPATYAAKLRKIDG